jgi:hypothetical protein
MSGPLVRVHCAYAEAADGWGTAASFSAGVRPCRARSIRGCTHAPTGGGRLQRERSRRSHAGSRIHSDSCAQLSSSAGAVWLDVAMANARGLDHAREATLNSLPYVGPAKARVS